MIKLPIKSKKALKLKSKDVPVLLITGIMNPAVGKQERKMKKTSTEKYEKTCLRWPH